MKKHTVSYDELIGRCDASITLAASNGIVSNKRLDMIADYNTRKFTFLVEDGDDVVHDTIGLQDAIDVYNDL